MSFMSGCSGTASLLTQGGQAAPQRGQATIKPLGLGGITRIGMRLPIDDQLDLVAQPPGGLVSGQQIDVVPVAHRLVTLIHGVVDSGLQTRTRKGSGSGAMP